MSRVKVCEVGLGARGAPWCCHCSVTAVGVGLGQGSVGLEGGLSNFVAGQKDNRSAEAPETSERATNALQFLPEDIKSS